jgi:hypothetical protein
MSESPGIWFRIGYALESARQQPLKRLRGLEERRAAAVPNDDEEGDDASQSLPARGLTQDDALNALVTAAAGALAGRVIGLVPAKSTPGMRALVRAGFAGAGAALLRELAGPLLKGRLELPELGSGSKDAVLAGAARGLLYGSLLEPRLPGPPAVQGALYATIEYAASPWGGVASLLGDRAPHRRIPLLAGLLEGYATDDDGYMDHLVFGIALALFYRSDDIEEMLDFDADE